MHDEALMQPINVFMQMPSCAPSAPGLETTGAEIGAGRVAEAMSWPGIVGLGEMMNYPGVIAGDQQMLAEIAATQRAGKTVGGHYASPDLGPTSPPTPPAARPTTTKARRESDAIARVRQGMRAMLRLGSAWYDVDGADHRGHRDGDSIRATSSSAPTTATPARWSTTATWTASCATPSTAACDPLIALQMATINTATHFGMERELGSIAPGRRAD